MVSSFLSFSLEVLFCVGALQGSKGVSTLGFGFEKAIHGPVGVLINKFIT